MHSIAIWEKKKDTNRRRRTGRMIWPVGPSRSDLNRSSSCSPPVRRKLEGKTWPPRSPPAIASSSSAACACWHPAPARARARAPALAAICRRLLPSAPIWPSRSPVSANATDAPAVAASRGDGCSSGGDGSSSSAHSPLLHALRTPSHRSHLTVATYRSACSNKLERRFQQKKNTCYFAMHQTAMAVVAEWDTGSSNFQRWLYHVAKITVGSSKTHLWFQQNNMLVPAKFTAGTNSSKGNTSSSKKFLP